MAGKLLVLILVCLATGENQREFDWNKETILLNWSKLSPNLKCGKRTVKISNDVRPEFNLEYIQTYSEKRFVWIGKQSVTGLNEDYAFELSRSEKNVFVIEEIVKLEDSPIGNDSYHTRALARCQRHIGLFYSDLTDWSKLVSAPGFKIMSTTESIEGGIDILILEFSVTPTKEESSAKEPLPTVKSGRVALLKSHNLLPLRWESDVAYAADKGEVAKISCKLVYDYTSHPIPVPIQKIQTRSFQGITDIETTEITYELVGSEPNKDDFRLPAFGLPEPPFLKQGIHHLWFMIAGAVVFSLGVFIVRRYPPS